MPSLRATGLAQCYRLLLVAAIGITGTWLSAQTAPAPAATAAAKHEALVLNPFEVTTAKNTGYVAANSLAGGRASTPSGVECLQPVRSAEIHALEHGKFLG